MRYFILLFIALILHWLPFVSLPLKYLETYFHEISHGIAALISGGSVVSIQVHVWGSGLCKTLGGNAFIISFFGYAGASLWGLLIFNLGQSKHKNVLIYIGVLQALLVTTLLFWARDMVTILILLGLIALFALSLRKIKGVWLTWLFQLIGISLMLNALRSPMFLIDGRARGDGAALAELTYVPEIIWVVVWFTVAIGCLYVSWKNGSNKQKLDLK